jgi:hypothetical protein
MMTQISNTTCWIPKCHLPALKAKVEALDRKAAKLGMEPFNIEVLEEAVKPWTRQILDLEDKIGYHREETIRAVKVRITGEPPQIDGYRLIARIDMAAAEAVRVTPLAWAYDRLPEPYRSGEATGHCDHCHQPRERRWLFLLEEMATGKILEVGKTCLKDFLGRQGGDAMLRRAQVLFSAINMIEEIDEDGGVQGGRPPEPVVELRWLMCAAAMQIRKRGFVSRTRAEETGDLATAEIVGEMTRSSVMRRKGMAAFESEDVAKADAVIAWAREVLPAKAEHSEFETMIVHHARFDMVGLRRGVGVMTAAITAYDRYKEQTAGLEGLLALGYAGDPGERLELVCERKRSFSSETRWGLMWKHIFCDTDGRQLVWKTGKAIEETKVKLKGRVKEHGEYRGIPQTVVTRCSVQPA